MPPSDPMAIPFPAPPPDAPGGAAFLASLADMKLSERQEAMAAALLAGDVPARLRRFVEVTLTRRGHTAVLRVAPDFLLIGSDDDFVTAPLRALVAQRVADALGCVLPTRPLVDAVLAAGAKAPLKGMWRAGAPAGWLESWRCHRDHQARIKRPTAPPGALVAGYLKDVVLTPSLQKKVARNRRWPVAIYGAWDAAKGKVVQGLVHDHAIDYVDYSHGTRLVSAVMTLDGVERAVADVLADPALAGALCDDGVIVPARYEPER